MEHLTLVIPAKNEKESLPTVLEELKKFNLKKIIVMEKNDIETLESIKDFNCKIIFQNNKGYGDALIQGINSVETKYFSIFNADGSFNPNELREMYNMLENGNAKMVFASRYENSCSSDDDTLVTFMGNFFHKLGNILFKLKITDILYTYVVGFTDVFKDLDIQSKDFGFCVELPIKAKKIIRLQHQNRTNEQELVAKKSKRNP